MTAVRGAQTSGLYNVWHRGYALIKEDLKGRRRHYEKYEKMGRTDFKIKE